MVNNCDDALAELIGLKNQFENVTGRDFTDPDFTGCRHAAHCMLYADWDTIVHKKYNPKAAVFMQMRFDGHLGFPGGMSNKDETPETTVNRELSEETGMDFGEVELKSEDLLRVHYYKEKKYLLHFYIKNISLEKFKECEQKTVNCQEYGSDVMGIIRTPLYTKTDGYRGFPAFLASPFIGNSKLQFLLGLQTKNILSLKEIEEAVVKSKSKKKQ